MIRVYLALHNTDDANTIINMIMIVMRAMAINTIMKIMKQC